MTTIMPTKEVKKLKKSNNKILDVMSKIDFSSVDSIKLENVKIRGELGWRKV